MLHKRYRLPSRIRLQQSKKIHTHAFTVIYTLNDSNTSRFRCTVSKKSVAKAVYRNRLKRSWSRCVFSSLGILSKGFDVIFMMRKEAAEIGEEKLCFLIQQTFNKVQNE